MMQVITAQKYCPTFCAWMAKKFNGEVNLDPAYTRTIALVDTDGGIASENDILTVVAFSNFTTYCAEITVASTGEKRQKCTYELLLAAYGYIFDYEGKDSVIGYIKTDNEPSLKLALQFGFKRLATVTDYWGEGKDAFLVQLTKKRWKTDFEPVLVGQLKQRDKYSPQQEELGNVDGIKSKTSKDS